MALSTAAIELIISAKNRAAKVINSVSEQLGRLTASALKATTIITAIFSGVAIKSAAEFELEMAKVAAKIGLDLVNGSEEAKAAFEALRKEAERVGATTSFTATQAAEGLKILSAAGLSATEAIASLAAVAQLAVGQDISLAEASTVLVTNTNILGEEFANAARTLDLLAKGASSGNTTVLDLTDAIAKAGLGAKRAGLSNAELVAILDVLANNGIRGAEAGTQLRVVTRDLNNETSKFAKSLKAANVDSKNFFEVLEFLRTGYQENNKAAIEASVALNAYGRTVADILATNPESLNRLIGVLNEVEGASKLASDTIGNTLIGQLLILISTADAFLRKFSTPIISPLTDTIQDIIDGISGLTENSAAVRRLTDTFLSAFNSLTEAFKKFASGFSFESITFRIRQFSRDSKQSLSQVSDDFVFAGSIISGVLNSIKLAFNTISAGIKASALVIVETLTVLSRPFPVLSNLVFELEQVSNRLTSSIVEDSNEMKEAFSSFTTKVGADTNKVISAINEAQSSLQDVDLSNLSAQQRDVLSFLESSLVNINDQLRQQALIDPSATLPKTINLLSQQRELVAQTVAEQNRLNAENQANITITQAAEARQAQLKIVTDSLGVSFDSLSDKQKEQAEKVAVLNTSYEKLVEVAGTAVAEATLGDNIANTYNELSIAVQKTTQAILDNEKAQRELTKAQEDYEQGLKNAGVLTTQEFDDKLKQLENSLNAVNTALEKGDINNQQARDGLAKIANEYERLGLVSEAEAVKVSASMLNVSDSTEQATQSFSNLNETVETTAINTQFENLNTTIKETSNQAAAISISIGETFDILRSQLAELNPELVDTFNSFLGVSDTINTPFNEAQQNLINVTAQLGQVKSASITLINDLKFLGEATQRALNLQVEFFNQQARAEQLSTAIQNIGFRTEDSADAALNLVDQFDLLDQQTLDSLRNQIERADEALIQFDRNVDSVTSNIQDRLDRINGDTEAILLREFEAEKAQIEELLTQAEGRREADLRKALNNLEILKQKELSDLEEKESRRNQLELEREQRRLERERNLPDNINNNRNNGENTERIRRGDNIININVDGQDLLSEQQIRDKIIPILSDIQRRSL